MDYELERTQLDGFEVLVDTALLHEETLETIVPDACPDMLRIVETDGTVCLKNKTAQNGRAEVEGSFCLGLLYLPDGESGIRRLPITIPFRCTVEDPALKADCSLEVETRLWHCDGRMVNPRKVLARAEAVVELRAYAAVSKRLCTGAISAPDEGLEQKVETEELYLVNCVAEKDFQITEDLPISAGKPAALELLKCRVQLCQGECKLIGSKLIFKGDARLSIVYRGEDQCVHHAGGELPYSQIMEVSGAGEGADCRLTLAVQELDCRLDGAEEGRGISVSLSVLAQAVVRENRRAEVLRDAYSTTEPVCCKWQRLPICRRGELGCRTQNIRELWETQEDVQEVLDCRVAVGQLSQRREGSRAELTAQTEVDLLYQGENGALCALQKTIEVPCTLDMAEDCRCQFRCMEVGEAYSTPAAGGIECRFALEFDYCVTQPAVLNLVEDLEQGDAPEDGTDQPSLVLRTLESGEELWDVAKAYRTTRADIISANELTDETEARGRLLLIPRKR